MPWKQYNLILYTVKIYFACTFKILMCSQNGSPTQGQTAEEQTTQGQTIYGKTTKGQNEKKNILCIISGLG